jgi:hypothetical protein
MAKPSIYSEEYWNAYAQYYIASQYPRFNMMQHQYNMPINPHYFQSHEIPNYYPNQALSPMAQSNYPNKYYKTKNLPSTKVGSEEHGNLQDLIKKLTHEYYSYYCYPYKAWSSYRDQDIQEIFDLQTRISIFRKIPNYVQYNDQYGRYYFIEEREMWNLEFDNIMNEIEVSR